MTQCSWKHFVDCQMLYQSALIMVLIVIVIVIAGRLWVRICFCSGLLPWQVMGGPTPSPSARWLLSICAVTTQVGASLISLLECCSPPLLGSPRSGGSLSNLWEVTLRSKPSVDWTWYKFYTVPWPLGLEVCPSSVPAASPWAILPTVTTPWAHCH